MGEAGRRKLAGIDHAPPGGPSATIPDDLRRDIAKAVRAVRVTQVGGSCLARTVLGLAILQDIGIRPSMKLGGMLFRAGPELDRDVLTFCNDRNVGTVTDDGVFAGHAWLEYQGDVIDFSVGDWHDQAEGCYLAERDRNSTFGLPTLGRIKFDIEPPEFLWQPAAPLKEAARPGSYPALGQFWYTGWNARNGNPDVFKNEEVRLQVRKLLPSTMLVAAELRLKERVAALLHQENTNAHPR